MSTERAYDIVVYGATGFTGGLIAEYLARNAPPGLRWAIAGRDALRLHGVKDYLEAIASAEPAEPATAELGIIQADSRDWASLVIMANQTRVLLTTVGPYIDDGANVVRACITAKTDYLDITGETDFVDNLVTDYHKGARDNQVRIVPCCGFDSIPADLGVLYTVAHMPEGVPLSIDGFVEAKGTFSGGTWRTAVKAMGRMRELERRQSERRGHRRAGQKKSADARRARIVKPSFHYSRRMNGWVFPVPTVDPYIVRRSAELLERYGPDFRYAHQWVSPSLEDLAKKTLGVGAVFMLSQFGPIRSRLLDWRQSGDGPTEEQRAASWFKLTFVGKTNGHETVVTRVSGGDPGYNETAKMAAESAMCLAQDELPERAGILTPAAAMGECLIERLQAAGMGFEVL